LKNKKNRKEIKVTKIIVVERPEECRYFERDSDESWCPQEQIWRGKMNEEAITSYRLVTGSTKTLPEKVHNTIQAGFVPFGSPFRTGNEIMLGGDPVYPSSCEHTAEIAQAMIFRGS